MKERPILFSGFMVRAILDGSKTQTRRPLKPQRRALDAQPSPFGTVGDRLWVRESFQVLAAGPVEHLPSVVRGDILHGDLSILRHDGVPMSVAYKATDSWCDSWRPSIHMPRWASRITLRITGNRIERLRKISNSEARLEGFLDSASHKEYTSSLAIDAFVALWDAMYLHRGLGWDNNPLVHVIEFEREN